MEGRSLGYTTTHPPPSLRPQCFLERRRRGRRDASPEYSPCFYRHGLGGLARLLVHPMLFVSCSCMPPGALDSRVHASAMQPSRRECPLIGSGNEHSKEEVNLESILPGAAVGEPRTPPDLGAFPDEMQGPRSLGRLRRRKFARRIALRREEARPAMVRGRVNCSDHARPSFHCLLARLLQAWPGLHVLAPSLPRHCARSLPYQRESLGIHSLAKARTPSRHRSRPAEDQ